MPNLKPVDELLFDAVRAHSMRTRGQPARRVTLHYSDGSETTLPVPERDAVPAVADSETATEQTSNAWPPLEGWAFRPGEAAFNGQRFKLAGKLLAILRELAERPGQPVTGDALKLKVWGEEPDMVEDANLQGHLSLLRKKLRDALGIADVNPIPHADRAYRLAVY